MATMLRVAVRGAGNVEGSKHGERTSSVVVPDFWKAFNKLVTAQWLAVRNEEEEGLSQQIQAEVTNLGLILALFTTMFLPLYYDEVSRIRVDGDGFAIEVATGILQPLIVSNTFIHEWMDVCYCGSLICGALGTVASVYLSLAVNECGSDAGTLVLIRKAGKLIHAPYYLFSLSVVFFAFGVWFHFFLVPKTVAGVVIKLTLAIACTCYLLTFMSYMVQAVYQSKYLEEVNPPLVIDSGEVASRAQAYLDDEGSLEGRSLKAFLKSLSPVTKDEYQAPLDAVTRAHAVKAYYTALSERLKIPLDTLLLLKDEIAS